ncbi:hypothetical protein C0993_010175, partial [Termitomyces sp. T159_Od127]
MANTQLEERPRMSYKLSDAMDTDPREGSTQPVIVQPNGSEFPSPAIDDPPPPQESNLSVHNTNQENEGTLHNQYEELFPMLPRQVTQRKESSQQAQLGRDNVTINITGLQRTATLNGGWPKIHLVLNPLENITLPQVKAWKKVATTKLWARLFRGLIHIKNDIALGVSFSLQDTSKESECFPTPYHMLISGTVPEQAEYLVNLEVISTKEATVVFKPFRDQHPSFVLTICGLTFHDLPEAHKAVKALMVSCLKDSEVMMKHIDNCMPMLK